MKLLTQKYQRTHIEDKYVAFSYRFDDPMLARNGLPSNGWIFVVVGEMEFRILLLVVDEIRAICARYLVLDPTIMGTMKGCVVRWWSIDSQYAVGKASSSNRALIVGWRVNEDVTL